MTKVTFVEAGGASHDVEVNDGWTLMQAATRNGLEGIVAECGGSAICGTCHVYVSESFLDRLPIPSAAENELLDFTAAERRPNSRLSCQIVVTPALEGMVLQLPDTQQ